MKPATTQPASTIWTRIAAGLTLAGKALLTGFLVAVGVATFNSFTIVPVILDDLWGSDDSDE